AGEGEIKSRTLIFRALGPNGATVPADDAMHGGQTNAGAFKFLGAVETLEDTEELIGVFHVEANPVVANEDGGLAIGLEGPDFDHRLGPRAGVFDGVGKEVGKDLLEKTGVALDGRQGLQTPLDAAAFGFSLEVGE